MPAAFHTEDLRHLNTGGASLAMIGGELVELALPASPAPFHTVGVPQLFDPSPRIAASTRSGRRLTPLLSTPHPFTKAVAGAGA